MRIYYYKPSITTVKGKILNKFLYVFSNFSRTRVQVVGMGKEFYDKFDIVKKLFKEADDALDIPLSKIILEGPKEELDLTYNTQPAIFLIITQYFK